MRHIQRKGEREGKKGGEGARERERECVCDRKIESKRAIDSERER